MHISKVMRVVDNTRQHVLLDLEVLQIRRKEFESEWIEESGGRGVGDVADRLEFLKPVDASQLEQQPSVERAEHRSPRLHRLPQLSVVFDDVTQSWRDLFVR